MSATAIGAQMTRKQQIMDVARRDGRVMVDALAAELGVSAHTIRRDINMLCEEARLRRLHGGAEYIDATRNLPYPARSVLNARAKEAIGRAVATLIPDGATVFISIGTTPALVAVALAGHENLTVVTNNLNAANALAETASNRIILPGGELRLPDRDILSEDAVEVFAKYRADYGIYGVGGIDIDGTLLDFHEPEVRVRERIRENARQSILVADASKFGRRAWAVGGQLLHANKLVVDQRPQAPFDALLQRYEGDLLIADKSDSAAP